MKVHFERQKPQGILGVDTIEGKLYRIISARNPDYIGHICGRCNVWMIGLSLDTLRSWSIQSEHIRYVECEKGEQITLEQT